LYLYFCDLRYSEERRNDGLLRLRGNSQRVEVSTQNLVKATTAELGRHEAGHGPGNNYQGWRGRVWMQDG
jgi:hypothetical protein